MSEWTEAREAEAQMWANLHIGDIAGAGMYLLDALDEIKRLREQHPRTIEQTRELNAVVEEGLQEEVHKYHAESERLKEELRIARNSWNFEEGKRIIAQRDKLLKTNNVLLDDLDTARDERGAALVECHDLRRQRDMAYGDGKRLRAERDAATIERDDLRDKRRTAEDHLRCIIAERDAALDAAEREGKEGRTVRLGRDAAVAETTGLRDKLRATEEALDKGEGEVERLKEERDALLKQRHDATESIRQAGNLASQAVWELSDIQGKPLSQACPECGAMECRHRSTESADETNHGNEEILRLRVELARLKGDLADMIEQTTGGQ